MIGAIGNVIADPVGKFIIVVEDSPAESVVSSDEEQEREVQRQTAIQLDVASVIEGHRQIEIEQQEEARALIEQQI